MFIYFQMSGDVFIIFVLTNRLAGALLSLRLHQLATDTNIEVS